MYWGSCVLSARGARRVFVTSTDALCGKADGVGAIWKASQAEIMLAANLPDTTQLATRANLASADTKILARHQIMALAVAEKCWVAAGLGTQRNRFRGETEGIRLPRIGCFGGSSIGGLSALLDEASTKPEPSPYGLSRWRDNAVVSAVALRFGLGGATLAANAASATGGQLVCLAGTFIQAGLIDAAMVVAADMAPAAYLRNTMMSNGSLSHDRQALPLSANRAGMAPSEGAACLIMESEEHMTERGALPLMQWLDGTMANEAHHLLAPQPNGDVLRELLTHCVAATTRSIDWVSLHATGTARFDPIEIASVASVLGQQKPWLTAFKRTTGHTLAAAGLMEAALIAEGFSKKQLPPWPENTDPALGLAAMRPPVKPATNIALQLGQGMGGTIVVNMFAAA